MTDETPRTNARIIDPDAVDTPDRTDAVVLSYTPRTGKKQRLRFERYETAEADWLRIEETWENGAWRQSGSELVEEMAVEGPRDG